MIMNQMCAQVVTVICMLAAVAKADIVWRLDQGSANVSISYVSGKYNITITSTSGGGVVRFWSTYNNSDIIRYVRCTASGVSTVTANIVPNPDNGYRVKTVEEISEQSSTHLQVTTCDVSQDIGSIDVWQIGTIEAGNDITGTIVANNSSGNSFIGYVHAAGSITGSVSASAGRIYEVVAGGDIGSSGSPAAITAKEYIRRVKGASVHATVSVTGTTGSDGAFGRLEATSGDVSGTLDCLKLESLSGNRDIVVAGDLDMVITVADHISTDVLVGGSLNGDIVIENDDRLEGQVVINAANGSGDWVGDVTIHSDTLSGPNYTQTSAEIGGGAVGLAPFNFHATNCIPADNTTVTSEPSSVILSHYGPVEKYGSTSIAELTIIRHLTTSPCALCDETVTGDFTWGYAANGRDIVITPEEGEAFEDGYDYHITPVVSGDTVLRCSGVTGNPVVQSYNYNFTLDVQ